MRPLTLSLLVAGIALAALPGAAQNAGPVLDLRGRVAVSGDLVRLADVAPLPETADPRLGDLVIGAAPPLGQALVFSRREIYEKLAGNGYLEARLEGAEQVRVERHGRLVETAFFQPAIADYVARHSGWGEGLTVTVLPGTPVAVPDGGVTWTVQPVNGEDFFGSVLFRVGALAGGREVYSGWVTARLKIEKSVAVTNRQLEKGETVTEGDIRWEKREITPFTRRALFAADDILGRRAGRIIRPNSVLTGDLLEGDWLVRRNGAATLSVTYRGVQATAPVRVLADGRLNDRVQVINDSSKQILTARVVGRGQLEVEVP